MFVFFLGNHQLLRDKNQVDTELNVHDKVSLNKVRKSAQKKCEMKNRKVLEMDLPKAKFG